MINRIKGTLISIRENKAEIETKSGLVYLVYISPKSTVKLGKNSEVMFFTHLQVREDAWTLYGFETEPELDFFHLLITVSGVGPKTAFNLMSHLTLDVIIKGIKENNPMLFSGVSGLGKKTTLKIILELSSKLNAKFDMRKMQLTPDDQTVIDTLVTLGFSKIDSANIMQKTPPNKSIEERVALALQELKPQHEKTK